ncbi:MAG: GNAT family N-acetyltransferase [Chloroflexaceae bacterium]|nr:GNAT family N-acetyltransferase [Chloroflexaceae bacterium]
MNVSIPYTLETERLLLRRLIPADHQPFADFICNPEATRYMVFTPEQKTYEGARAMLDWVMQSYDTEEPIYVLAITLKGQHVYIGSVGAAPLDSPSELEIFYTLRTAYQHVGYAVEATRRLLQHLFEHKTVERVFAYVMPENQASIRVARSLGMAYKGDVERNGLTGQQYMMQRDQVVVQPDL